MEFDAGAVREKREQLLLRLLFRATSAMNATMAQRIRERGFPDFQPSFTAILVHIDTTGTRISTIAARMETSRQAASQMLQSIEARGYVERVPDPEDGRAIIARHTVSGRKLLLTAMEVMLGIEGEYTAVLGDAGLQKLKRLLGRLVEETDPSGRLVPS